jgi:dTDP-4-dehydrorhamnose reductase
MTLRILQFGAAGQLAREVLRRQDARVQVRGLSRAEVDLADPAAVARAIEAEPKVDLVLNTAAYTAVDKAESEPEAAYAVNAWAPKAMAKACQARGVPLVQVSTEMVFSGAKAGAYAEDDPVGPLHVYGASKLAGEEAVLAYCDRASVMRVSWLFSAFGSNFLHAMLRLGKTQATLKVVGTSAASRPRPATSPPSSCPRPTALAEPPPARPNGAACMWSTRAWRPASRWRRRSSPSPGPTGRRL